MALLRLPPRIKVLEALGAVADGRVSVLDDKRGIVVSSEGDRRYRVYVDYERGHAYSDDNGTRLRGYVGYPIIAFLMRTGRIEYDERLGEAMRGIPWRRLNEKYKRYALVEAEVKKIAAERGVEPRELDAYIARVMGVLSKKRLYRLSAPPGWPAEAA